MKCQGSDPHSLHSPAVKKVKRHEEDRDPISATPPKISLSFRGTFFSPAHVTLSSPAFTFHTAVHNHSRDDTRCHRNANVQVQATIETIPRLEANVAKLPIINPIVLHHATFRVLESLLPVFRGRREKLHCSLSTC